MSDEEVANISNGIWLCETCHREFDQKFGNWGTDELNGMKRDAEARASRWQHNGPDGGIGLEYETLRRANAYLADMRGILASLRDPNHWADHEYGFEGGARAVQAAWSPGAQLPHIREPGIALLMKNIQRALEAIGEELIQNWRPTGGPSRQFYAYVESLDGNRAKRQDDLARAKALVGQFHGAVDAFYCRLDGAH